MTRDMVEVSGDGREALRPEYLSEGTTRLSNKDIISADFATRNWSIGAVIFTWIAIVWCVPTWMVAGGVVGMLSWSQGLLAMFLGSLMVAVFSVLNGYPAVKYGIPMAAVARSAFGIYGARLAGFVRSVMACGWCGVEFWIGATSLNGILIILFPGWWGDFGAGVWIMYVVFGALNVGLALGAHPAKSLRLYRLFNYATVPIMIVIGIAILIWVGTNVGFAPIMELEGEASGKTGLAVMALFATAALFPLLEFTDMVYGISDIIRYAKSQKIQVLGQLISIPIAYVTFAVIGLSAAGASKVMYGEILWNPIDLLTRLGTWWAAVGLLMFFLITLSTNVGINLIPGGFNISNISPQHISWRMGVVATAAVATLWMPWRFFGSYGDYVVHWLEVLGATIGPLAFILICDFWVVRKRKLYLYDLYAEDGIYSAAGGYNWAGIISFLVAAGTALYVNYVTGEMLLVLPAGGVVAFFGYWLLAKFWFVPTYQKEWSPSVL